MEGFDGKRDLDRVRIEMSERLPEPLAGLATLAFNYRWVWMSGAADLFEAADSDAWRHSNGNPVAVLEAVRPRRWRELAQDPAYVERVEEAVRRLEADLARPPLAAVPASHPIAYLCAEYGIHPSLPVYSGGLGVLAGDTVKTASDIALPMVAVGLFYRQGYFHQRIDFEGWQREFWTNANFARLPAVAVTGADDRRLTFDLVLRGRTVHVQIWRVQVGRIPLYLLDTNCPQNHPIDRWITGRLYVGDRETRLAQYAVLGIGAVRALAAMGIEPSLYHLNEGHASLSSFERLRVAVAAGDSFDEALARVRSRTVFTTHTPVPAGNEGYNAHEVDTVLASFMESAGIVPSTLHALGRIHPHDSHESVSMIPLSLRTSRAANGVSARHGQVARSMWKQMWPGRREEDVPIGSVTNGVHVSTWMAPPMQELFRRHLGADWTEHMADAGFAAAVRALPDAELWAVRCELRRRFVESLRVTWAEERLARGEPAAHVEAADRMLRTDVLTIGFARRVATYKRLYLLGRHPERLRALLTNPERPLQLVIAGKAHPSDGEAKRVLHDVLQLRNDPEAGTRLVFLEDYDLRFAPMMVAGVDVWLNVPRFPMEASGTSGMKVADNGGLNLSVLDGWWEEGCNDNNGWGIRSIEGDWGAQDHHDANALFDILEQQVVPLFYQRDADGIPHAWLERVKSSLASLVWAFSSERMLREYVVKMYAYAAPARGARPDSEAVDALAADTLGVVDQSQSECAVE